MKKASKWLSLEALKWCNGADYRIRTDDLPLTRQYKRTFPQKYFALIYDARIMVFRGEKALKTIFDVASY
jgi:hypothetical protein